MSVPAERLNTSPTLAELLHGFAEAPAIPVSGVASDSRRVGKGDLFLACGGENHHGLDYVDDVFHAGAAAIAWDSTTAATTPVTNTDTVMIPVAGLSKHLGEIASRFYGYPSKAMRVIGVTGTNGKTTVAWLIAQCLERLGQPCGYIGTLGSGIGDIDTGDGMTTPAAVELHERFAELRDQGAESTAIEVSSHALAQNRVDRVFFDSVLFTNLSRDHLDYHGDMKSYAESKARLFRDHSPGHRIVNIDSEFGAELANRHGPDVVTVSTDNDRVPNSNSYVFVRSVDANESGSKISVCSSWGDGEFLLPLPGAFNVENAVMVLAYLLKRGVSMSDACKSLCEAVAPPGRMQRVESAGDLPAVYVDYAHTPAAIEVALHALRAHCPGKLWCVFGCGGERDAGKRPLMALAAEQSADHVVVTSDNPRGEQPDEIISAIVAGLINADDATIIADRAAAIAWTIAAADPADIVLLAGKGHEGYQLIGNRRLRFSDYAVAAANLAARAEKSEVSE